MSIPESNLPQFDAQPVNEVVLDLQFSSLAGLSTPQLGLLWQEFRAQFPKVEEHPPLDRRMFALEPRPQPSVSVRLQPLNTLGPRRVWFVSETGTELIQIQQDRFIFNWRKLKNEAYPRYPHVRESFSRALDTFRRFLAKEKIGDTDRKSTRLNSSHIQKSRMPSSA